MINSPSCGRVLFDAVLHIDHSLNVVSTDHPVQSGANISDHAYKEPDEVTLEIGMSDAAVTGGGTNHSVNAYQILRSIAEKRELVTLVTRLNTYSNMLIVSLSAPDDYTTMFGLRATIQFKQVKIVNVSTVQIQQTVSATKPTAVVTTGSSSDTQKKKTTTTNKSTTTKKTSVLKSLVTSAKITTPTQTTKTAVKAAASVVSKVSAVLKPVVLNRMVALKQ